MKYLEVLFPHMVICWPGQELIQWIFKDKFSYPGCVNEICSKEPFNNEGRNKMPYISRTTF